MSWHKCASEIWNAIIFMRNIMFVVANWFEGNMSSNQRNMATKKTNWNTLLLWMKSFLFSIENRNEKKRWTWTSNWLVHHLWHRWRHRVVQSVRFLKATSMRRNCGTIKAFLPKAFRMKCVFAKKATVFVQIEINVRKVQFSTVQ